MAHPMKRKEVCVGRAEEGWGRELPKEKPELRHWRACGNHPHFSWWRHLANRGHALAASLLTAKEEYVKPALNNNTGAEGGSQEPRNADSFKRNGNVLKLTTETGYNKIY